MTRIGCRRIPHKDNVIDTDNRFSIERYRAELRLIQPWTRLITIERENIMRTKPGMNLRAAILSCALLMTTPLFARESTDVIVMKNGDRLTGEIKGLNEGVLYMSMEYILGTSSVQWSKVARLESKQLFLVKTEDGSVYTGTLDTTDIPGGRPMEITVAEISETRSIDSSRIVEMDMTSTKFYERFNGYINTGI